MRRKQTLNHSLLNITPTGNEFRILVMYRKREGLEKWGNEEGVGGSREGQGVRGI